MKSDMKQISLRGPTYIRRHGTELGRMWFVHLAVSKVCSAVLRVSLRTQNISDEEATTYINNSVDLWIYLMKGKTLLIYVPNASIHLQKLNLKNGVKYYNFRSKNLDRGAHSES